MVSQKVDLAAERVRKQIEKVQKRRFRIVLVE